MQASEVSCYTPQSIFWATKWYINYCIRFFLFNMFHYKVQSTISFTLSVHLYAIMVGGSRRMILVSPETCTNIFWILPQLVKDTIINLSLSHFKKCNFRKQIRIKSCKVSEWTTMVASSYLLCAAYTKLQRWACFQVAACYRILCPLFSLKLKVIHLNNFKKQNLCSSLLLIVQLFTFPLQKLLRLLYAIHYIFIKCTLQRIPCVAAFSEEIQQAHPILGRVSLTCE